LIAFSWGVWYYSVEAEVDMPGLFFIVLGIYWLLFKPESTKTTVLVAFFLSVAAGFHLTNGLIILSVCLVLIIRKRSLISISKLLSFYFIFLAVPYFIFYLVTKFNILNLFKNMVFGGKDYYAGYEINYWTPFSFDSFFESIRTISSSVLGITTPFSLFISLVFLIFIVTVITISFRKNKDKKYYELLSWILPYFLFFSIWAHTNLGFKLNVLIPLLILFVFSLSRFSSIIFKNIIIFIVIGVFFINFYFVVLPANDSQKNPSYQLAETIRNKTGKDSLIIIAGCGTVISTYCKIYIPYFANRNIFIMDWMLGKGLSLKAIHSALEEKSKNHTLYFLSELSSLSKAVTCLLQNHQIVPADYLSFINQFKFKQKIPLTEKYYLLEID
jgi:hypothetical protein